MCKFKLYQEVFIKPTKQLGIVVQIDTQLYTKQQIGYWCILKDSSNGLANYYLEPDLIDLKLAVNTFIEDLDSTING